MAWDASKHVVINRKSVEIKNGNEVFVERYSYDGGEQRIKFGLIITKRDGSKSHAPLGGITPDIAIKLAEIIKEVA